MNITKFVILTVSILAADSYAQSNSHARLTLGAIEDNRATDDNSAGCEIKIKVLGDIAGEVRDVRSIHLWTAVDDQGRDLRLHERELCDSPTGRKSGSCYEIPIKLKNPSRCSSTIRELSGDLELYVPSRDDSARMITGSPMAFLGQEIRSKPINGAQVKIKSLTKTDYEALRQEEKEKKKKEEASAPTNAMDTVVVAMQKAFQGFFGGAMEPDEQSVILQVNDPSNCLVDIEVTDTDLKRIQENCHFTSGNYWIFMFDELPPSNAYTIVYFSTPRSLVHVPIKLTDIALP